MRATIALEVEFPEALDQGGEDWHMARVWDETISCYVPNNERANTIRVAKIRSWSFKPQS